MSKIDTVHEFMEDIHFVEDTGRDVDGYIERMRELTILIKEKASGLSDTPLANTKYFNDCDLISEYESIVEKINKRPYLVWYNGAIYRITVRGLALNVDSKEKNALELTSAPSDYVHFSHILCLSEVVGKDNNISKDSPELVMNKQVIASNSPKFVIDSYLFRGRIPGYSSGVSMEVFPRSLLKNHSGGLGYIDLHEFKPEKEEGRYFWFKNKGDFRGNNYYRKPLQYVYAYKLNIKNVEEGLLNTSVSKLGKDFDDYPFIYNLHSIDDFEGLYFKHKLNDILNTGDRLAIYYSKSAVDVREKDYGARTHNIMSLSISKMYAKESDAYGEVCEVIKDSIVKYSRNGVVEKFYYNKEIDAFEPVSTIGRYTKPLKIKDIMGEGRLTDIGKNPSLTISKFDTMNAQGGEVRGDSIYSNDKLINFRTWYVYTPEPDFSSSLPYVAKSIKEGTGVYNYDSGTFIGRYSDNNRSYKYLIKDGVTYPLTGTMHTGMDNQLTLLAMDNIPICYSVLRRRYLEESEVEDKYGWNTLDIFPMKQGMFNLVEDKDARTNHGNSRYLSETDVLDKEGNIDEEYMVKDYIDGDEFAEYGINYSNILRHAIFKLKESNSLGIKNFSRLVENNPVFFKVYQDVDFTDSEIIERFE